MTSIGNYAFLGSEITSVTIPGSAQLVGSYAFYGCSKLENVTIKEGVLAIGNKIFKHCESLKSVTIPNSLVCIGNESFDGDYNLTSIYSFAEIPPVCTDYSEEHIGNGMFVKSKKHDMWDSVIIDSDEPASADIEEPTVTDKDVSAATSQSKLMSMGMNEPTSTGSSFSLADPQVTGNCTLYVPMESVEDYKIYDSWRDFTHVEGFDPTGIKDIKDITASDSDAKLQRIYNLNGIRLSKPQPGLNIINGRKVVVK